MRKNGASNMAKIKSDGSLQHLTIDLLHLDDANPRFGGRGTKKLAESSVLNEIVSQHGITDVICSIAANGFFDSEPIVGAINKGHGSEVTVVEGNRRLSACLILARDERASKHVSLSNKHESDSFTAQSKIPIQVYDWSNDAHRLKLLPYLGIRHIVGPTEWDSYAKAAWVALTLRESDLDIDDIRTMIGDDQKFIDRIVEGYFFVEQVMRDNVYDPQESLRNGRGSFQEFPFSWVYTALGYKSIREYLELPKHISIEEDPLPTTSVNQASDLLGFMFGASGRNAAIDDSRKIGKLAQALSNEDSIAALKRGKSAEQALEMLRPAETRFKDLLKKADSAVAECVSLASGFSSLERSEIEALLGSVESVGERVDALYELLESLKPKKRSTKRKKGGR